MKAERRSDAATNRKQEYLVWDQSESAYYWFETPRDALTLVNEMLEEGGSVRLWLGAIF